VPSLISSSSQLISLSEPEDELLLSSLMNSADCSHPAKLNPSTGSFYTGAAAGRTLNAKTSAKSTGCERECPTPKS